MTINEMMLPLIPSQVLRYAQTFGETVK